VPQQRADLFKVVMLLHHLQRDAMPEVVRLEDRVAPDHRDTDLACWCSITRRYRSSNPWSPTPEAACGSFAQM